MRKNLIIINGAPGMGKTTVCEELAKVLPRNVFLDCDCFMWANPYTVTEETERIRYENIIYTTKNYLSCSEYDNVMINWVFVEQQAIDRILAGLILTNVEVHIYSLVCNTDIWKTRMENDRINLKRKIDTTYEKWKKRIAEGYYDRISGRILDTSDITAEQAAEIIVDEVNNHAENISR